MSSIHRSFFLKQTKLLTSRFKLSGILLVAFSCCFSAEAKCVKLYDDGVYIGCRVYDEQREIGFDSERVKEIPCLKLCFHWEAILAGTAKKQISTPNYAVETQISKKIDELHSLVNCNKAQVTKFCGKFNHTCHMGNPRGDMPELGTTYSDLCQLGHSFFQLKSGQNYPRRVLEVSPDGRYLETTSPIGEKQYFEVLERSELGEFTKLQEILSNEAFRETNRVKYEESDLAVAV